MPRLLAAEQVARAPQLQVAQRDPVPRSQVSMMLEDPQTFLRVRVHLIGRSEEHTSNSSHLGISYAVFCLKKKKKNKTTINQVTLILKYCCKHISIFTRITRILFNNVQILIGRSLDSHSHDMLHCHSLVKE